MLKKLRRQFFFYAPEDFRKKEGSLFPTFEISFSPPFTRGSALYGAPVGARARTFGLCAFVCACVRARVPAYIYCVHIYRPATHPQLRLIWVLFKFVYVK